MTIYTHIYTVPTPHHPILSINLISLGKGANRGCYYTAKEAEMLKPCISIIPDNFVCVWGTVDAL